MSERESNDWKVVDLFHEEIFEKKRKKSDDNICEYQYFDRG